MEQPCTHRKHSVLRTRSHKPEHKADEFPSHNDNSQTTCQSGLGVCEASLSSPGRLVLSDLIGAGYGQMVNECRAILKRLTLAHSPALALLAAPPFGLGSGLLRLRAPQEGRRSRRRWPPWCCARWASCPCLMPSSSGAAAGVGDMNQCVS